MVKIYGALVQAHANARKRTCDDARSFMYMTLLTSLRCESVISSETAQPVNIPRPLEDTSEQMYNSGRYMQVPPREALDAARSIYKQYSKKPKKELIGNPSNVQRPLALDFESIFAQALLSCLSAPATAGGADAPTLPPPTPLTVVAAAEKLLHRLAASRQMLHLLVSPANDIVWPTTALRLLRVSLLIHLSYVASHPPNCLQLQYWYQLPASNASTMTTSATGTASATLHQYMESVHPSVLITVDSAATTDALATALPSCRTKLFGSVDTPGTFPASALASFALVLTNTALVAGAAGVDIAALPDVYTEGTGIFAPVTAFSKSAAVFAAVHQHLVKTESTAVITGHGVPPVASDPDVLKGGLEEVTRRVLAMVTASQVGKDSALGRVRAEWQLHAAAIARGLPLSMRALAIAESSDCPGGWAMLTEAIEAFSEVLLGLINRAWSLELLRVQAEEKQVLHLGCGKDRAAEDRQGF
jgi:hypothetical protein